MPRWVGVLFGLLGFPFSTRVLIFGLQPFIPWEYLVAGPGAHQTHTLSVLVVCTGGTSWCDMLTLPLSFISPRGYGEGISTSVSTATTAYCNSRGIRLDVARGAPPAIPSGPA